MGTGKSLHWNDPQTAPEWDYNSTPELNRPHLFPLQVSESCIVVGGVGGYRGHDPCTFVLPDGEHGESVYDVVAGEGSLQGQAKEVLQHYHDNKAGHTFV